MKRYDNYDCEEAYKRDLNKDIEKKARKQYEQDNPLQIPEYEQQWEEQNEKLQEWEYERLLKEGKVKSLYRTTTTKSQNIESGTTLLEAQIYPSFYHKADIPRTKKEKKSKPSQRNLNDKNSRRYFVRIANINFGKEDLWCSFGWDEEHMPEDAEGAKKDISNFIKRINRRRKKKGKQNIKYMIVFAFDNYTRPHFHIIMTGEGIDRDELEALWGKCERPNTRRIAPDKDFLLSGLASYMSRNPHGSKRWWASKNLQKPAKPSRSYSKFKKTKVQRMAHDYETMKAEMEKAYAGFKFLDAETRYNGVTAAFYIYARMVRN